MSHWQVLQRPEIRAIGRAFEVPEHNCTVASRGQGIRVCIEDDAGRVAWANSHSNSRLAHTVLAGRAPWRGGKQRVPCLFRHLMGGTSCGSGAGPP